MNLGDLHAALLALLVVLFALQTLIFLTLMAIIRRLS